MVLVKKIRVQYVRAHKDYTFDVSPTVTVITGANGSGKTSLIEALHVALTGSSFKGTDRDILRSDAPWYRVDVLFDDDTKRTVKYNPDSTSGRKQFIINEKTNYRLPQQHRYPVVLFEPDDLRLLNGSPTRRRQFIDRFISQIDPQYSKAVSRYERALKQRNSLLKRSMVTNDDLFAWNISLSEYGAYIITQRLHFVEELNKQLGTIYRIISQTKDEVKVRYSSTLGTNIQQKLLSDLHSFTERDKLLGFTSTGPHRHDVLFDFNNSSALSIASRGEVRSIILALKFLEVHITEDITGKKPIVLLDDVFSELDGTRQRNLVTEFTNHQIIVTSVGVIPIESSTVINLKSLAT
jgi:DNA replication and repair protein RecF